MSQTIIKGIGSAASIAVLALGGAAAPALANTHHHKKHHAKRHSTQASNTSDSGSAAPSNGETALTGDTLTSAEAAATAANPGSTAIDATTETDSSLAGAAYEIHITQADGTPAVVIEDASFTVLATQAGGGGCGGHDGPGQHD